MWIFFSCLSAFFAGITSILSKAGIQKTDSTLANALRTGVVLFFSWLIVFLVGSQDEIGSIAPKTLLFLALSGLTSCARGLCYFKALQSGDINRVVPIDKLGTILSVLFAIVFLGEREFLGRKLFFLLLIGAGTYLMVGKAEPSREKTGYGWLFYALLSAFFAALTTVLEKIGIDGVESNLGTALRTIVMLAMAWVMVGFGRKKQSLRSLERRELLFIVLSGIAAGASWLFYYMALQKGIVSVVVPIDKMSVLVTVAFSAIVFKEKLDRKSAAGLGLMSAGTLCMAIFL